MNLSTKIFFICILFFITAFQSFAQSCKGTLIVNTNREKSLIFLDEKIIGRGKIEIELEPGFYNIIVKENKNTWGNKSLSKAVQLKECNHQALTFNFDDEVYLQTNPQDAAVFINDSLIGYTPLYLSNSYSNIQFKKTGYENKFILLEDYEKNPDELGNLDFIGEIEETSFYEKDLFKYLLAGIVILGGTTAYFKLQADKKFDEYELTGDKKLLDQTEKHDLISGITFAALQINFGALIYFFLND